MKKMVRALTVFALVLTLLVPTALTAASAESFFSGAYRMTMDLKLASNLFLARYSVTVYLDDTEIGKLIQGGSLVKSQTVSRGVHTLRFRADMSNIPDLTYNLMVETDLTLEASLQTHQNYVEIKTIDVILPGQEISDSETGTVKEPESTGGSGSSIWDELIGKLIFYALIHGI